MLRSTNLEAVKTILRGGGKGSELVDIHT